MFEEVFLNFQFPSVCCSDNSAEFCSDVMKSLCKLCKVDKKTIPIYSPSGNLSERRISTIKSYIRCFMLNEKIRNSWNKYLRLSQYAINTTPHTRGCFSPFNLLFGRLEHLIIGDIKFGGIYSYETFYDDVRAAIKNFNAVASEKIEKSRGKDREKLNMRRKMKTFSPGVKVLVRRFVRGSFDPFFDSAEIVKDVSKQTVIVRRRLRGKLQEQKIHKKDVFHFPTLTNESVCSPNASDEEGDVDETML